MRLRIEAEKQLGNFHFNINADITDKRIGIFGESGSGKSTLVHMLSGHLHPDRGEIFLDNDCIFSSSRALNLQPRHRRVGLVFQKPSLFPHLSVSRNLFYGYRRCSKEHRKVTPDELIAVLKLDGLLERGVLNLSGGEKQRVALARAVLASPRLLLMDEPLSALDDGLRFQIIPYLKSVTEQFGIPCIFISHSVVEMQLMANRILTLQSGRLNEETTPDQLARKTMARSQRGYVNLLELDGATSEGGLFAYRWGDGRLLISDGNSRSSALFELSSRDIILFQKHPEAISARNLLECRVKETFSVDNRVGIVLSSGNSQLVAEIVRKAADELQITAGSTVFAAIKASSFRRLI